MRHVDHKWTGSYPWRRPHYVDEPYCSQYVDAWNRTGFASAHPKKRYVQVLQYIADHDGCTRRQIVHDIYGYDTNSHDSDGKLTYRGQASTLFSQLLYIDVIDYDENFRYHITDDGKEVLKTAYTNANIKLFK